MATIAVIGTFDTKGQEHDFLRDAIIALGHEVILIDVGTGSAPSVKPDICRQEVAAMAGLDLPSLLARADRGECVVAMSQAAPVCLTRLANEGKIHAVVSLGGGGGTAIATAGMRALPLGFPKLMVSTLASGNTSHYIGTSDIVMMPSIVDVAGLNSVSKGVYLRAAGAICGMIDAARSTSGERPLIVASMFGNTTECITIARQVLEEAGYEVLVFHATGAGGRTMEAVIESGAVAGVLDITTTEWADELVGGTLSAGPHRMDAAAHAKVPAVIAPGCLDMVNFGARDTVPQEFEGRNFYIHNPQVTLMRTTPDECRELGRILAEKANQSTAPTSILIPEKAISVVSAAGGPFHDPAADEALFQSIETHSRQPVDRHPLEINDPAFATACAHKLLSLIQSTSI